jgi:hypothetical protein
MRPSEICFAAILVIVSAIVIFRAGFDYGRQSERFIHHQIPVVGGGTALIVPKEWNVIPVWDKFGRPHIDTDRDCENVK